jgi:CTP synthase
MEQTKYIVVTGGVLSGLGKGVAAASIGNLLSSQLRVIPVKCDGYLNTDPGTMNPIEHGEVFVLDDGGEVDMDFGHYERFLGVTAKSKWNLTMGKVFQNILEKERKGEYLGSTVQYIPHVTNVIKETLTGIADEEKADILLIEIGGTVGDMENELYIEAVRQLAQEVGKKNIMFIHLTYIPIPDNTKEQKSKPTQQSVKLLNERGIFPDVLIGRGKMALDDKIKHKIALFCNVDESAVISGVDVDTVYKIPLCFNDERLPELLHKRLSIYSPPELAKWKTLVGRIENPTNKIRIALCGKYTELHDSYASVIEALVHSGAHHDTRVEIVWLETTNLEKNHRELAKRLKDVQGVIVPGGFGVRGIEGKIAVIQYARENGIPFLGLCYGMQLAVIEFARNVCNITDAQTTESQDEGIKVKDPVVCILPSQQNITKKGGTMRLGGQDVAIMPGTLAEKMYQSQNIRERFRHRYEINPQYVARLEECGMVFSGRHPVEDIVQIMELPEHPYFIGAQFHPELTSSLTKPAPLFSGLVEKALELSNLVKS